MTQGKQVVTLHGNPLTLSGEAIQIGTQMQDTALLGNDMNPVKLSDFKGKVVVISVVSSLDTPVCEMQTRHFNTEASQLSEDVVILTVSMDLPFAQKRWCGAAGVDKVITLSDHRTAAFGESSGLLIPDARLLARAVIILDREGIVRYYQLVKEVSNEPDYAEVLSAVKNVL